MEFQCAIKQFGLARDYDWGSAFALFTMKDCGNRFRFGSSIPSSPDLYSVVFVWLACGGGSFGVAPKHSIELLHVHNENHALSLRSPRHDFIFDVIRHSHFGIQSIVAFLDLHFERGD